ncbi:oxidoreductase [Thecamonas trahens ATCC 50062]|uniref:Glutamate-rich WD repeat-containing protein 1 n=1 Tax=Thecamonas trahens ATCC 50062 TaxID=461836 RepID=A0A0L0DPP8_THETB|nr:oxidoreductase [Thecamonas trahens ATCC 50062]KNC53403.1 oxidoreductase [Thecamonas trahens ATCC 50062]|eukprot:XP_013754442.1 oxidoreductase [Thecamonas trahens ATCC 50062]
MVFSGRTLFITGASRGIGLAIALRAAKDGANVVVAAKTVNPHPKLDGTIYTAASAIEEAGGRAMPMQVDIRDAEAVKEAMDHAAKVFGGVDVLVNNASAISLTGTLETPVKTYDLMHAINARGTFVTTQAALPHLLKSTTGPAPHVLNISPPLNLDPKWFADHTAYTAAKYGMSLAVLGMAAEFSGKVAFNALWPRTTIATAAIKNVIGGDELMNRSRKPDIVADAAAIILAQPIEYSGNFAIDDDILRDATLGGDPSIDLDSYSVVRGADLQPDFSSKRATARRAGLVLVPAAAHYIDESVVQSRTTDGLQFEDLAEDEFEEELVVGIGVDSDDDGQGPSLDLAQVGGMIDISNMSGQGASSSGSTPQVWRPEDGLAEGEQLDYDPSVYNLFHTMDMEWPALSFDIVRDSLGYRRSRFPHTVYAVAGTQAEDASANALVVMKLSSLARNGHGEKPEASDDESDDESDDDEFDMEPVVEYRSIPFSGCANRVRSMPQTPTTIAAWSDLGTVAIYDLQHYLSALDVPPPLPLAREPEPMHVFTGHTMEGFALDWSPVTQGRLLSGDCARNIHLWEPRESGWAVDIAPYVGHTDSVEDLQWSPNQASVFASASVDGSVAIWDVRKKGGPALSRPAHSSDVNVISWNPLVEFLLVSGGDDGTFAIWDLRFFQDADEGYEQRFSYHSAPITSVDWHPTEASSLAVSSDDNQITLWDLGVEADDEELRNDAEFVADYPPQLLFVHQGLTEVKEIHWHPQIPGMLMATGAEGFNVFKPINF